MSKLIDEDKLDRLLQLSSDQGYLGGLSDIEVEKLYAEAIALRHFFALMQTATKELCNSVYGGFGTPTLRYFNQAVAADITGEGRHHCQTMEKVAQGYFKNMWPKDTAWHNELREKFPHFMTEETVPQSIQKDIIITCDTDSNYVTFDYVFESIGINPKTVDIKLAVDFIVYFMRTKMDPMYARVLEATIAKRNGQSTMVFELEAVGGFGIFAAKKKYVYAKLWQDGKFVADKKLLKSTGIELAQKSAPLHVRNTIKTFVNTIFVRKGEIDSNTFFGMCKSVKDKLADCSPPELSKTNNIGKYEQYVIDDKESIKLRPKCPAAIRGAARYNQMIYKAGLQSTYPYLKSGMKGKMYYDKQSQPFTYPVDIDFPTELAPEMSVAIQLEKLIFGPVKRLVSGGLIDGDLNKMGKDKMQRGFSSMFSLKK